MSGVTAIGRSLPRLDGPEKVAGVTRFAADVQLPGMLHARLVVSPHAHARVTRIVTELDPADQPIVPAEETVPATAVPAGDVPVLLRPAD